MPRKKIRLLSAAAASGLLLTGITAAVVTGPGHAARHTALAANLTAAQAVKLDNCPLLKVGYQGGCVNQLQAELNAANGTDIPADGIFGAETQKGVMLFQQNNHITPIDGIVGPQTKAALDNLGANSAAPATGTPAPTTPAAGPPAADVPPHATVSAPTPLPGPAKVDGGGTIVCSSAPQIITPLWWNPQVVTDASGKEFVQGVVGIKTFGVGCGDWVKIILQTKVCGLFGCSYQDVTSAKYMELPMNGEEIFPVLTAPLRNGTNRYRLEIDKTTFVWDGDNNPGPGAAGFVSESESEYSDGVQLTS
jgi:peptidoglycan hydrolase-like protein with peptidoglycan-binding domain